MLKKNINNKFIAKLLNIQTENQRNNLPLLN